MLGVSFWLWKADFTLNVTLSEKHSSTILSISYLCLPARSVSFHISTSLFGGFYFPFLNGLKKKKNNLWSDIKTSLLNVRHAQSAGLTGGFSKFHREGKKPGLTWSTYVSVITLRLHSPSRHAGRPVPGLFSVSVTLSKCQHPTQITNEWHNIHPFRPLVKQKTKAYFKKVPFPAEKKKKIPPTSKRSTYAKTKHFNGTFRSFSKQLIANSGKKKRIPAAFWQRWGYTLDMLPVYCRATSRDKQPFVL